MEYIKKNELFLLEEIVKRNFSSKYKDSVLGIFWTILNPILMMALLTIIFSTIFGRKIENYPVYYLCGRILFSLFNGSVGVSMSALKGNKNILKRTQSSKHIFVLGGIISEFLNFLITLAVLMVIMIVTHAPFHWTIPLAIIPIISMLMMVTGLGLMLSIVCVYYSDVAHLWTIVTTLLLYASAIFYPMEIIPEPYHQYLILNPIFWIINQFRYFVYYGTIPEIGYIINSLLLSLIILVFGIIVFKKYENRVTLRL